jgi:hypothetical protein
VPPQRNALAPRATLAACSALALLVALLAAAHPLAAQRNARVMRFNAAQMALAADTIVAGKVTAVRVEPHPQFPEMSTLVVTLQITDLWKGQSGAPFSFRQYVSDEADIRTHLNYRVGQEVLLFMTRPSKYGLSAPVGLDQGRFSVTVDAQGNRQAINGANNSGLFHNVEKTRPGLSTRMSAAAQQMVAQHRAGAVAYDQLKSIVEAALTPAAN